MQIIIFILTASFVEVTYTTLYVGHIERFPLAVRIKEIAQDLNLGLSTVAQALADKGTISPKTRLLVKEHAARLGYTPNRSAQRIRCGRTGIIGLIVPDVVLSPYVEVVQHLFHEVEQQGKELQITLTEFYPELENRAFKSLLGLRVDGIIAKVGFPRWEDVPANHYLRRVKQEGIPTVLYSNPIEGSDLPYIKHPLFPSTKLVVRHLLSLGHRRIGVLVPGVRPFVEPMPAWLNAIREELAAGNNDVELEILGLETQQVRGIFPDYMMNQYHALYAMAAGRDLFRAANALEHRPTALVAYSDPVAIGAICEAQASGLRVGRDIAIAGCAQMASSFFSPISLTTVDRRPQLYAHKLLNLLGMYMDENRRAQAPTCDEVEPLLVIGESTVGA